MRMSACFVALALAAAGCTDNEPTTGAATPTSVPVSDAGATVTNDGATPTPMIVEVTTSDGLMFNPATVTIARGGTVRWRNTGAIAHTVTSGASSMASSSPGTLFDTPLAAGQTFQFTFNTAGTQPYFCRPHEFMGMKGSVVVQ
jgi:plastocyanin